jgi:hypothetical protein
VAGKDIALAAYLIRGVGPGAAIAILSNLERRNSSDGRQVPCHSVRVTHVYIAGGSENV